MHLPVPRSAADKHTLLDVAGAGAKVWVTNTTLAGGQGPWQVRGARLAAGSQALFKGALAPSCLLMRDLRTVALTVLPSWAAFSLAPRQCLHRCAKTHGVAAAAPSRSQRPTQAGACGPELTATRACMQTASSPTFGTTTAPRPPWRTRAAPVSAPPSHSTGACSLTMACRRQSRASSPWPALRPTTPSPSRTAPSTTAARRRCGCGARPRTSTRSRR